MSRTVPGNEEQVAEAPEEVNHQQTHPIPLVRDEQRGDDVEYVPGNSAEPGLRVDITEPQEDMNLIAFQHQDSGLRLVELPPTYSSL